MMRLRSPSRVAPRNTAGEIAALRLQGTVWEGSHAVLVAYRGAVAFGRALGGLGISANMLTLTSLALAAAACVTAALGHLAFAAVLVVLSGALDALDGVVARATNTVTRFGALLDSTVDRLSDALPLVGIAAYFSASGPLALVPVLAIVGGFTVSYVRARAEGLGVQLPALFMRRAERVVLVVLSLGLGAIPFAASVPAPLMLLGVALLAVLNLVGVVAVMRAAAEALKDAPAPAE